LKTEALFSLLLTCTAVACTPAPESPASATAPAAHADPPGPVKHVVLVTIDGMLPESYLHPDAHGLRVPTLRRLVAEGARSDGAMSVFPTVTYPSHTSMTTGVNPGSHGITSNRAFDPTDTDMEGWRWYAEDIQKDPIWRVVERAGYPAALVQWPVSVGARVTWLVPEYWRAKDDNDRKLLRALATPGLLEKVASLHPDFWPRYAPPDVKDSALTDVASYVLETGRPTLLQLHLVEVDDAQHHFGVWSPEARAALENDDAQLSRLLEVLARSGLAPETAVIVASDHGFMNVDKLVRPGVLLHDAGLVTTDAGGKITGWKATLVVNGGSAYVYLHDPADAATRDAVRTLFEAKAKDPESGIGRVFSPDEIKALGGDPEAAFALEATPGTSLGTGYTGDYIGEARYKATHGFDPRRPEMRASLILYGPTVAHGTLEGARLVDIAPTIAAWLGVPLAGVEGRELKP
jgi:predicted AlkP superfamily pyrophosphatase or phosphodiesterase